MNAITSLCLLRGDMLASGSTDKTVRVWDIKHNRCIKVLAGHTGQVNALVTLADEYEIFLCSASHDKSIIVRTLF